MSEAHSAFVLHPCCSARRLSAGCASFAVPGRPADLSIFTKEGQLDPVREVDERPVESLGIGDLLARQPMAAFPTSMAVVRIQAPGFGADSTTQNRRIRPVHGRDVAPRRRRRPHSRSSPSCRC
jgi:hypothetical protein